ncbi:MAG: hypothetical protein V4638_02195 [Bacteroidota bacterium]
MKSCLAFVFAITSFLGVAQTVTVASTEEYTNQLQNAYWTRVLGQDENGYYLLREYGPITNSKIVLEKYSPALKLVYATDIEATSGTFNDSKLHRLTEMSNGSIYVFLEGWSKAAAQNSFILKRVNEDGTLDAEDVVLETEPSAGQMKSANYSISFSPDGSKLLVLTQKPFVKDGPEGIRLQVFETKSFTSIWKKDVALANTSERFPRNDIQVNNEGVAFMFKDIKISNKEHQYQLLTYSNDVEKLQNLNFNVYAPGKNKMMINKAGHLLVCGTLYPAGGRADDWQGILFLEASPQGEIVSLKTDMIPADIQAQAGVPVKNGILPNFAFKDVLPKSDGGYILLMEEQKEFKNIVGQTTPPVYEYDLTFGNALALSFDAKGTLLWSTSLEKKQTEKTKDPKLKFGSFAYQLKNDKLYLVWNFTALQRDLVSGYRYWMDKNGSKINIDNLFGKEAFYPTLLTVIDANGRFEFSDRTFSSLPLDEIQKPNAFPMAIDPSMFFATDKGMVILSHMPGIEAKRFKFNTIGY